MSDFSSRIRECRETKGLTQKQVADQLGLSVVLWQKYENGTRTPTFDGLIKVAKFFECDVNYLLGITDDPIPGSALLLATEFIPIPQIDRTGDILFEYEKNGEKATLRFPRDASDREINRKIKQLLPLLRGLGLTDDGRE